MELIRLKVNGEEKELAVKKNWTLLYALRESLCLTGTKRGCDTGDCGACKVIMDGKAVNSCLLLAHKLNGKSITTIEGIASPAGLHPIQQAFIDAGAVQCGFCSPGMIISAKALLDANPAPNPDQINSAIDNNLCRCTGYVKIARAIQLAAERLRDELQGGE